MVLVFTYSRICKYIFVNSCFNNRQWQQIAKHWVHHKGTNVIIVSFKHMHTTKLLLINSFTSHCWQDKRKRNCAIECHELCVDYNVLVRSLVPYTQYRIPFNISTHNNRVSMTCNVFVGTLFCSILSAYRTLHRHICEFTTLDLSRCIFYFLLCTQVIVSLVNDNINVSNSNSRSVLHAQLIDVICIAPKTKPLIGRILHHTHTHTQHINYELQFRNLFQILFYARNECVVEWKIRKYCEMSECWCLCAINRCISNMINFMKNNYFAWVFRIFTLNVHVGNDQLTVSWIFRSIRLLIAFIYICNVIHHHKCINCHVAGSAVFPIYAVYGHRQPDVLQIRIWQKEWESMKLIVWNISIAAKCTFLLFIFNCFLFFLFFSQALATVTETIGEFDTMHIGRWLDSMSIDASLNLNLA